MEGKLKIFAIGSVSNAQQRVQSKLLELSEKIILFRWLTDLDLIQVIVIFLIPFTAVIFLWSNKRGYLLFLRAHCYNSIVVSRGYVWNDLSQRACIIAA